MNVWFLASRPKTLIAAVAPVIVAEGLAVRLHVFDWTACLLCLVFSCLVQIATNFANDYYDYVQGVDTQHRIGPTRAVASGLITPQSMYRAIFKTTLCAAAVGIGIFVLAPWWLLPLGAVCLFLIYAYTATPFCLGYRGWGDLLVLIFFGFVAVGCTFYIQSGFWCWEVLWSALAIGLLSTNLLLVNNYRDYDTDIQAGKKTLIVRFGKGFGRVQYLLNGLISLAVPIIFKMNGYQWFILMPCALLFFFMKDMRQLCQARSSSSFEVLLSNTARFLMLYAISFTLVLQLS